MRPALLLFLSFVIALHPQASAQTYPFAAYTTSDGLAQSGVGCIFQDSRGYMWFGTWGGISRYDGKEFRSYGNSALHVRSIGEDGRGVLWIGSFNGLAKLYPGETGLRWGTDSTDLLTTAYVIAVLKDPMGNMWVGTDEGLCIVTPSGERLENQLDPNTRNSLIRSLKWDGRGGMLMSTNRGIVRCRIDEDGTVESEMVLQDPGIGDIVSSTKGEIFAVSLKERAVLSYRNAGWKTVLSCKPYGPSVQVRCLGEDGNGNLWVGTTAGVILLEDGQAIHLSRREGLPNQYVAAIYRDRENIMWLGTEGGALKLPGTSIRSYTQTTGLPGDHVIAILQDRNHRMWFGTYNGVGRLDPAGNMQTLSFDPRHLSVQTFMETRDGDIWIGLVDSLAVYARGSHPLTHALRGGKTPAVRFLQEKDGSVWCGGNQGIVKLSKEGKTLLSLDTTDGLPHSGIVAMFKDSESRLWFGTTSRGAGFYQDGKITALDQTDGLPHDWVTSIAADKHGTLWFGTQQGAVSWNGETFEPIPAAEEDLRNGIVQFVVRDSSRHLWFGTLRGIYEWDDSLLAHYDTYDGLIADGTRCGYVDAEGDLWVGTVGGVSRFNLATRDRAVLPPPVQIEGLALDDQTEPGRRTSFSYVENTLTMHFNSLSFRDEDRTEFQWMLAGFDPAWQPPRPERHVRYTHIPWGSYEFLVRVRNRNTAWSEPARIAFVVNSPFWATWWFVSMAVAAFGGTLFLVYKRRISKLEKEKKLQQEFSLRLMESQETERKRIAGELHDGLGQDLLVIRNRALMALKEADPGKPVHEQLNQISSVATQAIDGVREIARDLRPYQLDRLGLTRAITAIPSGLATTIRFTLNVDPIDDRVGKDQAIHLYRIVQEGINNILKHSNAEEAQVEIRAGANHLRLTISDNGKGFSTTTAESNHRGFGLVGITERAKAMNGTATIESNPGKGTILTVLLPTAKRVT